MAEGFIRSGLSFRLNPGHLLFPVFLDLVIGPNGRRLVDRDHHRLATIAPTHEVADEILGNLLQPVIPSNQVILPGKLPLKLLLLVLIEVCLVDQGFQILLEVFIGKLKLRNAVFIIKWNGVLILGRILVGVDTYIFTKYFAGLLLPDHKRSARKPDECCMGKGIAHIEGEDVILGSMGLVRHHDDVGAIGELRISFTFLSSEFLNERKKVAVVFF